LQREESIVSTLVLVFPFYNLTFTRKKTFLHRSAYNFLSARSSVGKSARKHRLTKPVKSASRRCRSLVIVSRLFRFIVHIRTYLLTLYCSPRNDVYYSAYVKYLHKSLYDDDDVRGVYPPSAPTFPQVAPTQLIYSLQAFEFSCIWTQADKRKLLEKNRVDRFIELD